LLQLQPRALRLGRLLLQLLLELLLLGHQRSFLLLCFGQPRNLLVELVSQGLLLGLKSLLLQQSFRLAGRELLLQGLDVCFQFGFGILLYLGLLLSLLHQVFYLLLCLCKLFTKPLLAGRHLLPQRRQPLRVRQPGRGLRRPLGGPPLQLRDGRRLVRAHLFHPFKLPSFILHFRLEG